MTRLPAAADRREQRSLKALIERLHTFYGALPPPPHEPFTLFVWEVLGVHSTPKKRDAALQALKRIRALTPDAMYRAPRQKLEDAVALAGPYLEQRLKAVRTGVEMFRRSPDLPRLIRGPITAARRALRGLPQMGEAGAHRMLLFAADHAVMPVDARVSRVSRRLGYGQEEKDFTRTARSIRDGLASELTPDADAYRDAFVYMNHHGAVTCTETEPHCRVCPLLDACEYGSARVSSVTRHVF
jgi:endonuclease III